MWTGDLMWWQRLQRAPPTARFLRVSSLLIETTPFCHRSIKSVPTPLAMMSLQGLFIEAGGRGSKPHWACLLGYFGDISVSEIFRVQRGKKKIMEKKVTSEEETSSSRRVKEENAAK